MDRTDHAGEAEGRLLNLIRKARTLLREMETADGDELAAPTLERLSAFSGLFRAEVAIVRLMGLRRSGSPARPLGPLGRELPGGKP